MSLIELQRDVRAWLVREDRWAARRLGADAAPGLRVYQNNYRAQLVACLEESFPHTRDWLGGEAFHAAVVTHVDRVPPSSWTLDAYACDFPATLAMLYPADAEVAELGWIEHALGEAFVGGDAPSIAADAVGDIDWDSAVLRFVPTLDQADLTTNAPALWAAMEAGEAPPAAELLPSRGAVLVWRYDNVSRFRAIDREELAAFLLARAGMPFAAMCEALVEAYGEAEGIRLAGLYLGRWLSDGLVRAIDAAS